MAPKTQEHSTIKRDILKPVTNEWHEILNSVSRSNHENEKVSAHGNTNTTCSKNLSCQFQVIHADRSP